MTDPTAAQLLAFARAISMADLLDTPESRRPAAAIITAIHANQAAGRPVVPATAQVADLVDDPALAGAAILELAALIETLLARLFDGNDSLIVGFLQRWAIDAEVAR